MQGYITTIRKKHALVPKHVSPNQLVLAGFESLFERKLKIDNCWVKLANLILWDDICYLYFKFQPANIMGRPPLNPRVVLESLILKHLCNLNDRYTVDNISDDFYTKFFLGYSIFTYEVPFNTSLFISFSTKLVFENLNAINGLSR